MTARIVRASPQRERVDELLVLKPRRGACPPGRLPSRVRVALVWVATVLPALSVSRAVEPQRTPQQQAKLAEAEKLLAQIRKLNDEGQYKVAIPFAKKILELNREVLGEKHRDTAMSLNNLAGLFDSIGNYDAAQPLYEQALAINREVLGAKHPDTASALNNLGHLLLAMGDYAAARPYYEQALAIRKEVLGAKHPSTAQSLNNMGYLLSAVGDYPTARTHYEQALAIRREALGAKHPATATTLNNLGALLDSMGDPVGARPYYEQALAIRKEVLGVKHPETAQPLNNLGYALQAMGDYAGAKAYFEQALAINQEALGPKHTTTADGLNNLGCVLQSLGDYAQARPYYAQSVAIRKEVLGANHPDTALSLNNLASLEAADSHWDTAATLRDEARRMVRRHVARVLPALSAKEQAKFLNMKDEGAFQASLSLGLIRSGDPALSTLSAGWLANGKAVAHEAAAQQALVAQESADPNMSATRKQLLDIRRRLASLVYAAPTGGQENSRKEELDKLERQEAQLSLAIAQAHGETFQADPWVDIAAVRKAIPADALLIDIVRFNLFDFRVKRKEKYFGPARYAAWLIPPAGQGDVRIVDLGEADPIDQAVGAARIAMQQAIGSGQEQGIILQKGDPEAEKSIQAAWAAVTKKVLTPLADGLKDGQTIILSPDASLWLVPWGALPFPDGTYAIERWNIRYVVSSRDLIAKSHTVAKAGPPVIFADPNYDLSPDGAAAATTAVLRGQQPAGRELLRGSDAGSLAALRHAPRLPGTAREATAIVPKLQAYVGAAPIVYQDQYALKAVFKELHRPKVAVLSTHGFFLEDQEVKHDDRDRMLASNITRPVALTVAGKPLENPLLRCGLLLAGCNTGAKSQTGDDGILTGLEIVGTDLRGTELVVLSACETGLGQVHNGEGVAGLRQAFQLAGAQAVVSTLWQIPDAQSARLMSDFFSNLSSGQSKSDALRNAQLTMIKARREKYAAAHPFYWAAFTLTGQ